MVRTTSNGVVLFFDGTIEFNIQAVAKTLRKRFSLSLGERLYSTNHALTVIVGEDEQTTSLDCFKKS